MKYRVHLAEQMHAQARATVCLHGEANANLESMPAVA